MAQLIISTQTKDESPIAGASIRIENSVTNKAHNTQTTSVGTGMFSDLQAGTYLLTIIASNFKQKQESITLESDQNRDIRITLIPELAISTSQNQVNDVVISVTPATTTEGQVAVLSAQIQGQTNGTKYKWEVDNGILSDPTSLITNWDTTGIGAGKYTATLYTQDSAGEAMVELGSTSLTVTQRPISRDDIVPVALARDNTPQTDDQALWVAIRSRTNAIGFKSYSEFVNNILCGDGDNNHPGTANLRLKRGELNPQFTGMGTYNLLKVATEAFLLLGCGTLIKDEVKFDEDQEEKRLGRRLTIKDIQEKLGDYLGESATLPYLRLILRNAFGEDYEDKKIIDSPFCDGILASNVDAGTAPCFLELIWSYWHEEGMLAQTTNAVTLRFQNKRTPSLKDPLARLALDPVRPMSNLLWGYIQDEPFRLSVPRRAYEYDNHYGLALVGKVVPKLTSAETRSKFLEAFHNLLNTATAFYRDDDDKMITADGFSLLNALKEVHLLLAQGANNQFRELPWTSRVEMLIQQWLLARPEIQRFLGGRTMVPYKEAWMGQVDSMKQLQEWSDTSVTHFRDLGAFGEQIILSVRYGNWIDITDQDNAKNWARYWRQEIQGYIHAYRAATGIDLASTPVNTTMPAMLLQNRLAKQASA